MEFTWWMDRLKAKGGKRAARVALIAMLFDWEGVSPGLDGGLEAIYVAEVGTTTEFRIFLHAVGIDFLNAMDVKEDTVDRLIVWRADSSAVDEADIRWLDNNNRLFIIAPSPIEIDPRSLRKAIDREWALRIRAPIVVAFMEYWYADDPHLRDALVLLGRRTWFRASLDEVFLASRQETALGFVELFHDMVADALPAAAATDQHHDHDPEPIAKPVAGVLRKLSEMTGFGEAGEWGMRLSEEVNLYMRGELAWEDLDKGVLLTSPPGGGKTTFARALAAELDVPFFPTSYAEWSGLKDLGGDSISKVLNKLFADWRALVKKAESKVILVFIDEIDSIGVRGANPRADHWFAPVINTWLQFLDGAVSREGIIVIAATNYPDMVDPALKRPGRLDRLIEIPMPGPTELAGIVAHHLGVDADAPATIAGARAVRGRNPAQIEQLCREARRLGRMLKRDADGHDLADVVRMSCVERDPGVDRHVAIHEAAHAVAFFMSGIAHLVDSVDIEGDGTYGGKVTGRWPAIPSKVDFEKRSIVALAGRAAEELLLGVTTRGAAGDLQAVTAYARDMRFRYGMRDRISALGENDRLTPHEAEIVELDVKEAYLKTLALVGRCRHDILHLADVLLERRYLDGDEALKVFRDFASDGFFARPANDDREVLVDMVNDRVPVRRSLQARA